MRFLFFFSALARVGAGLGVALLVTACAGQPEPELLAETECREPRPQVCTMVYAPVCARHADDTRETLSSACNACAIDTVIDYDVGACEDGSL